jgi:hypothetical protein
MSAVAAAADALLSRRDTQDLQITAKPIAG